MRNGGLYKKKLRRNLTLLPVITFLSQSRFYYPIAILLYHAVTGSYTLASLVFTVMSLSSVLLEVPSGVMSDRWGRKPVIILWGLCIILSVLCFLTALSIEGGALWLYAGGAFYGAVIALRSGNNDALLFETLRYFRREKEYPKVFGRIRSMGQLALGITGVVTGVFLWAGFSFQTLLLLTLVPVTINFVLTFFIIEPKVHTVEESKFLAHVIEGAKQIAKHEKLRWYALATSINNGLSMSDHVFVPSFIALVWPVWAVPFFRTGQNGFGALCFWFAGDIVKKFGPLRTLYAGSVLTTILHAAAYMLQMIASPFLLILSQINYTSAQAADSALQQKYFTNKQRSTMGSIISLMTEMITAIGIVCLGAIADLTSPAIALLLLLMVRMLPVMGIYGQMYRKARL